MIKVARLGAGRMGAIHARDTAAHAAEMDHFTGVLAGKATPETGFTASVASPRLAEAAARPAATGAPVRP